MGSNSTSPKLMKNTSCAGPKNSRFEPQKAYRGQIQNY